MQCYEHELICRILETRIRAIDPSAIPEQLQVSEALRDRGIHSLSALAAMAPGVLDAIAAELTAGVPLAA